MDLPTRRRWRLGLRRGRRGRSGVFRITRRRLIYEARRQGRIASLGRFLTQDLLILLKYELPPALVCQIVRIILLEEVCHLLGTVVILHDQDT
ncbi:MAG: hypothetical protein DI590_26135 [Methylorubrum populi]|nr:MAG: hypothetical protein DI590_26135 [Methylorubrum populi]